MKRTSIDSIRRATVFLGYADHEEVKFTGTGVIVDIEGVKHLATAKHVIQDKKTGKYRPGMSVFTNHIGGGIAVLSLIETMSIYRSNWISHSDAKVDLAITPFAYDRTRCDVMSVGKEYYRYPDVLYPSQDVFYVSYQPGIESNDSINPIVRRGAISAFNDDRSFIIDGFAFPGNSGSPVYLRPSSVTATEAGFTIGAAPQDAFGIIGIIGSYVTYKDSAPSKQREQERIWFEENTGLSVVWPMSFVDEIAASPEFKNQFTDVMNIERQRKAAH
jgi:hypothetical protein